MTDSQQTPPGALSGEEYKEFVTGSPGGITYRVEDPVSRLVYDFDGFANGHLVWTIADYEGQFAEVGPIDGGIDQAYIDSARLQDAVRQGYPILWCVQKAADGERLRAVLQEAGFSSITVQHEVPE